MNLHLKFASLLRNRISIIMTVESLVESLCTLLRKAFNTAINYLLKTFMSLLSPVMMIRALHLTQKMRRPGMCLTTPFSLLLLLVDGCVWCYTE